MPRGSRISVGEKRTRRKGPKSKSGCRTCKTRRIKCDEARPACAKCINGGWICDGYPPGQHAADSFPTALSKEVSEAGSSELQPIQQNEDTKKEETAQLPSNFFRNSLLDFNATSTEHRSFSFFLHMTAPDLASFSTSSFWTRVVLRIASTEKAVQHALVAIAALHEDHLREMEHQKPVNEFFSLSQYNKAIHTLNSRLSSDRSSFLIALITCHLFVYLELLRKSPEAALTQFYSGLKLLPLYNKRYAKSNEISRSDEDPDIYEQLAWTFHQYRLSVLGTFFPIPRKLKHPRRNPGLEPYLGKPFSSFHEAKERLHTLLVHSFKPYHRVPGPAALEDATSVEVKLREELALHLNDWNVQLKQFVGERLSPPTASDMQAIRMLKIQNLIAIIWNSVAITGSQNTYDSLIEHFHSVVSLAELIISQKLSEDETLTASPTILPQLQKQIPSPSAELTSTEPSSSSSIGDVDFDDEVTYPLYFTVIKCRSPTLRRQALSLLSLITPALERIRNTKLFKAIAEHVVSFEEGHCPQPITEDITTWPTEAQRIQRVYFMPIYDRHRKTQTAMFVWQPNGPGTEMQNWMKRFEL